MKHTDTFFLFPIKIYQDSDTEVEEKPSYEEIDWAVGYARLPLKELYNLTWMDGYSKTKTGEQAIKEGFDLTQVISEIYGKYICTWPRKKFESKLNDFIEKLEKETDEESRQEPGE